METVVLRVCGFGVSCFLLPRRGVMSLTCLLGMFRLLGVIFLLPYLVDNCSFSIRVSHLAIIK